MTPLAATPPKAPVKPDTLLYVFPEGERWYENPGMLMHGLFHALHSYTRENYSMQFTSEGVLSTDPADRLVSAAIFHRFAESFLINETCMQSDRAGAHVRAIRIYTDSSIVSGVIWQFKENKVMLSSRYADESRIEELAPAIHGYKEVFRFLRERAKSSNDRALALDIKDGPRAWNKVMQWSAGAHLAFQLLHNTVNAFERTDLDKPDAVADNRIVQAFKALAILGDKDLIPKEVLPSAFALLKSDWGDNETAQVLVGELDIKAQFNNPELMARFEENYDRLKADPALKPVFKALFDETALSYPAATADFNRMAGFSKDALDALKVMASKDPLLLKEQAAFIASYREILKDTLGLISHKVGFTEGFRAVAKIFTDEQKSEIKSVFYKFLSHADKRPHLRLLLKNINNLEKCSADDLKVIINKTTDVKLLAAYLEFLESGQINKANAIVWFCGRQDSKEATLNQFADKLALHSGDLSLDALQKIILSDSESVLGIVDDIKPVRSVAVTVASAKVVAPESVQSPAIAWAKSVGLGNVITSFSQQKLAVFECQHRAIADMPGLIPGLILSNRNLANSWLENLVPYPERCDRLSTLLTAAVPLTPDISAKYNLSPYKLAKKFLDLAAG